MSQVEATPAGLCTARSVVGLCSELSSRVSCWPRLYPRQREAVLRIANIEIGSTTGVHSSPAGSPAGSGEATAGGNSGEVQS